MKFKIGADLLYKRLCTLRKAINPKATLPILSNFHFEVEGGVLNIKASSFELQMKTTITLDAPSEDGTMLVMSSLMLNTLKTLCGETIEIMSDEGLGKGCIRSKNGTFDFTYDHTDEFPLMIQLSDDAKTLSIHPDVLSNGVSMALPFACTDEFRPTMCSVNMRMKDMRVTFTATDVHNILRASSNVDALTDAEILLPRWLCNVIPSVVGGASGLVRMSFDDKRVRILTDEYEVVTSLVEGRYPNCDAVIPNYDKKCVVDSAELRSLLARAINFTNSFTTLLKAKFSGGRLTLVGEDYDFGKKSDEYITYKGDTEDLTLGISGKVLYSVLSTLKSKTLFISYTEAHRPIIIEPTEPLNGMTVLSMMMPMKLDD